MRVHTHMCVCVCERAHRHTNSEATPAQTTKSFKKKAFKKIIWLIPLHLNKNIPDSKKMTQLFLKISTGSTSHVQTPINDALDFLTTLMMEKFLFALRVF